MSHTAKEKKENNESSQKKWILLVLLLLLITFVAIGVTVWAVWFRKPTVILTPDYAPPETDKNAEPIPDDDDTKLDAPAGGGAISLQYTNSVLIDLSDNKAVLYYANPGKSTQDIVLQIVIRDVILAQSGKIVPGNRISSLELLDGAAAKLSEGVYNGKFVFLSYDPQTGEKAMVNTEAVITVTVQA